MISKGGKAVAAATQAMMTALRQPEFRLSQQAISAAKVASSYCLGTDNPQGFIDHVVMTIEAGPLELDIYAQVTFSDQGPIFAELYVYHRKEYKMKISCPFGADGVPDPWRIR